MEYNLHMLMRANNGKIKKLIQQKLTSTIRALNLESAYINFWNKGNNISTLREKILQFPRFNPLVINIRTNNQRFKYFTIPEVDDLYDYSRRNFYGWEDIARQIYYEWCSESRTVVDVGAYSGVYTILAIINGGPVNIICFEPNPRMLPILERNIYLNVDGLGKVTVNSFALSSVDGQLYFSENEHTSASQILSATSFNNDSTLNENVTKVRVAKLDSLDLTEKIDLMKVDIEGHEIDFLHGSSITLSKDHPIILMEALDSLEYSKQKELLKKFGYSHVIAVRERNGIIKNYVWIGREHEYFISKISHIIEKFSLTVDEIK